jgi:hypothetical protein
MVRQIIAAIVLGISMIAGAFVGPAFFVGVSSGPEESAWQIVKGVLVGAIAGGVTFKAIQRRKSINAWLDGEI